MAKFQQLIHFCGHIHRCINDFDFIHRPGRQPCTCWRRELDFHAVPSRTRFRHLHRRSPIGEVITLFIIKVAGLVMWQRSIL